MKNKQLFFVILSLLCGDIASAEETSWSLASSVYSKYIGKIGAIFSGDPILVNELDWSRGDLFAGVWNSTGLDRYPYGSTYADELDLWFGYGHTFDWIHVQTDVAYYTVKDLTRMNDDLWVVEGEVSLSKIPFVQPYVSFCQFEKVDRNSFPGGMFYWAGIRRTQPLGFSVGKTKQTLNLDLMTAYSNGALGKNPGFVFERLTVNLPIVLSGRMTLTPSVVLQSPIGGQDHHQVAYTTKDEVVWGVSAGYKF